MKCGKIKGKHVIMITKHEASRQWWFSLLLYSSSSSEHQLASLLHLVNWGLERLWKEWLQRMKGISSGFSTPNIWHLGISGTNRHKKISQLYFTPALKYTIDYFSNSSKSNSASISGVLMKNLESNGFFVLEEHSEGFQPSFRSHPQLTSLGHIFIL